MYVKILTRETDTSPERSISILGVDEIEFFENKLDPEEFVQFCKGATQTWVTGEETDAEGKRSIGCLSMKKVNGKNLFILFDRVAFLCNEQGKAVERYLVT